MTIPNIGMVTREVPSGRGFEVRAVFPGVANLDFAARVGSVHMWICRGVPRPSRN